MFAGYYIHSLDPNLIHMGPIQIRWYGLMYLVGYLIGYYQFVRRYRLGLFKLSPELSQTLVTYLMIGMMIGARLIYVVVYNPMYYKDHLSEVFAVWQGGLSFHGGLIGFMGAMVLFARVHRVGFFHLADSVVLGAATGVFFGRIGNFINGELYGRTTSVPWGIIFPEGGLEPRHPSQLYQAFGEGLCVFLLLNLIERRERKLGFSPSPDDVRELQKNQANSKKNKQPLIWKRTGITGCSFLILYALARFTVEFFREPDRQLGFFGGYFTMGQILCAIMGASGVWMLFRQIKNAKTEEYPIPRLPEPTESR